MQENIRKIEQILDKLEENGVVVLDLSDGEQILNLLTKYKKIEQENITLKSFTSCLFNEDITKEFIRKDVINQKIKKLENERFNYEEEFKHDQDEDYYFDLNAINTSIYVLQDLLEETEEE